MKCGGKGEWSGQPLHDSVAIFIVSAAPWCRRKSAGFAAAGDRLLQPASSRWRASPPGRRTLHSRSQPSCPVRDWIRASRGHEQCTLKQQQWADKALPAHPLRTGCDRAATILRVHTSDPPAAAVARLVSNLKFDRATHRIGQNLKSCSDDRIQWLYHYKYSAAARAERLYRRFRHRCCRRNRRLLWLRRRIWRPVFPGVCRQRRSCHTVQSADVEQHSQHRHYRQRRNFRTTSAPSSAANLLTASNHL